MEKKLGPWDSFMVAFDVECGTLNSDIASSRTSYFSAITIQSCQPFHLIIQHVKKAIVFTSNRPCYVRVVLSIKLCFCRRQVDFAQ